MNGDILIKIVPSDYTSSTCSNLEILHKMSLQFGKGMATPKERQPITGQYFVGLTYLDEVTFYVYLLSSHTYGDFNGLPLLLNFYPTSGK